MSLYPQVSIVIIIKKKPSSKTLLLIAHVDHHKRPQVDTIQRPKHCGKISLADTSSHNTYIYGSETSQKD